MRVGVVRRGMHAEVPFRGAQRGRRASRGAAVISHSRLLAIGALVVIAVLLLVFQYQFRDFEASSAARVFGAVTTTLAAPGTPTVWFGLGRPGAFGLMITPDRSSALLIAPNCVLGMLPSIPRKVAPGWVCAGPAGAAALLLTGNIAWIGLIVAMIRLYGLGTGYQLGHLVLGSLLSIVCIASSMVVLTLIFTGRRQRWVASALLASRTRSWSKSHVTIRVFCASAKSGRE